MVTMSRFIATWFFIGYIPFFSGTWGALASFPAMFFVWIIAGKIGFFIGAFLIGVMGFWAVSQGSGDDAPEIVIDEVIGQWIAVTPIVLLNPEPLWIWLLLSFAFFRFFDIIKPWPIRNVENFSGALGIIGDDVVAGLCAALSLWAMMLMYAGNSHIL